MNKLALLSIAAVMIVAGCTGETAVTGNGLAFTDFSPSLDAVDGANKTVKISFEVENKGGATIPQVLTCLMGSNFDYSGSIADGLWSTTDTICKADTNLRAYDPINNLPGDTYSDDWTLRSPCVPETLSRTDQFTARTFYNYTTTAASSVWIYEENEFTAAKQKGETLPSSMTVQKTAGPIDITFTTEQPTRIDDSNKEFTLRITVSNVGGGTVFKPISSSFTEGTSIPTVDDTQLNKFSATMSAPAGLNFTDCNLAEQLQDIELRKGESQSITCDITVLDTITTKKSYPITIEATYGYYIESQTSISVNGKRSDPIC